MGERFITNARYSQKTEGELTAQELMAAEMYWVKVIQKQDFSQDGSQLKAQQSVNRTWKYKNLKPFFDENGLFVWVTGHYTQILAASMGATNKTQILTVVSKRLSCKSDAFGSQRYSSVDERKIF